MMRDSFREYYELTEFEVEALWDSAVIIPDTNVLLNLFRFSKDAREALMEALERYRDRLWLPHHVGYEFHRRRHEVIGDTEKLFNELEEEIEKAKKGIFAKLDNTKKHPTIDHADFREKAGSALDTLNDELTKFRDEHRNVVSGKQGFSSVLEGVTKVFDSKVGEGFSDEELTDIYQEGAARYAAGLPPGNLDAKKGGQEQYGDLVIWKEIVRHCGQNDVPLIFVTDDNKSDWWFRPNGRTIGPRPELIREFHNVTGNILHFYNSERFLYYANKREGKPLNSELLNEVKSVSRRARAGSFRRESAKAETHASTDIDKDLPSLVLAAELDRIARQGRLEDHYGSYSDEELFYLDRELDDLDEYIESLGLKMDLADSREEYAELRNAMSDLVMKRKWMRAKLSRLRHPSVRGFVDDGHSRPVY